MKKWNLFKFIGLWIVVLVTTISFSLMSPPILYSFYQETLYQINFDGTPVDMGVFNRTIITNNTVNASTNYVQSSNIRISGIIVPNIILPDKNFMVTLLIDNNNLNPQYLVISLSIFLNHEGIPIYDVPYWPLTVQENTIYNSSIIQINCSSIRDTTGLIKSSVRPGKVIQPGINQFEIDIFANNKSHVCDAYFPIKVKSDSHLLQISNGIAIGSIIIGVATTAMWIRKDRKRKGERESPVPILSQKKTGEEHEETR